MAKKKASKGPAPGSRIRIRDGATMPEAPTISLAGWTGSLVDTAGGKETPQFIVEWDEATAQRIPKSYVEECESKQLLWTMACLPADVVEFVDGGL